MMEVAPSAEQSLTEAKKFADALEKLANRAQGVQEVLHSVKFPEAVGKLHRDYEALRAKMTVLENQTAQEIESFKIERIVRVNNIAQLIRSARQRANKALDDLEQAKQVGDTRLARLAEHTLDTINSEIDCSSLTIELQSLKNVDLVAPEKYAALEAFLNRPLHYLKTSTLSPTEISLTVISDRINVGQPVEIEIRQTRCEKRIMELLNVRVQDAISNDLPKRQYLKQRVDGNPSVVVHFTPKSPGRHVFTVQIYGEHVRSSPLSLVVVEAGDPHPLPVPTSYEPVAPAIVLSSSAQSRLGSSINRLPNTAGDSAFRPISLSRRAHMMVNAALGNRRATQAVNGNGSATNDGFNIRPFSRSLNHPIGLSGFGRGQYVPPADRVSTFNNSLRPTGAAVSNQSTPVSRQNDSPLTSTTAVGMLIDVGTENDEENRVNGHSEDINQQQLQPTTMTTMTQNGSSPSVFSSDSERSSLSRPTELAYQGQAVALSSKGQNTGEDWDALPIASSSSATQPMSTNQPQSSPSQTPLPVQLHRIKIEYDADSSVENASIQPAPEGQQQTSLSGSTPVIPKAEVKMEVDSFSYFNQLSENSHPTASLQPPPMRAASNGIRIDLLEMYEKSPRKAIVGTQTVVLGEAGRDNDAYVHLSKPIGCTYDEQSSQWIVCDTGHNIIKLFNADGRRNMLLKDGLNAPSAVAVVESGSTFAVKDDLSILLFDQRTGSVVLNVAERLRKPMGLALDGQGRLVTLANAFHGVDADIQSFDVRAPLRAVSKFPYRPDFAGNRCLLKPRFIAADGDLLAVTDLGVDLVSLTSLSDGHTLKTFGGKSGRPGEFMFVSGVRFDGARNMIIGDAKGNRVQVFDASGAFKCRVEVSSPVGFVSDLHLTDDGRLMCLDRGKNIAKVFQLSGGN